MEQFIEEPKDGKEMNLDYVLDQVLGRTDETEDQGVDEEDDAPVEGGAEPVDAQDDAPSEEDSKVEERVKELVAKSESGTISDEEMEELNSLADLEIEEGETEAEKEEDKQGEFKVPDYADVVSKVYGRTIENEEDMADAIKAMAEDIESFRQADAQIEKAIQSSPEIETFMRSLLSSGGTKNLIELLVESGIDPAEQVPSPQDKGYEKYVLAKIEKRQRDEKAKEFEVKREQNLKASQSSAVDFIQSKKMDEQQAKKVLAQLDKDFSDITNGIVSKEFLERVYKGVIFDDEVVKAEKRGEVRAMNTKIKGYKIKKKGDGVPRTQSSSSLIQSQATMYTKNDGADEFAKFLGN